MRKIERLIKCSGPDYNFNMAVVGTGKNPTLYFFVQDVYYPEDDFDSKELPFAVGTPEKYIDEWLLSIDMNAFKKIAKVIKNVKG